MEVFKKHLANVQKLKENVLSKELFDFIRSIEREMIDLNKNQLYKNSKDIYGDAIGFYSKATEIISGGSKKAGEPYDMKDTGVFFSKFYVKANNNVLIFGSNDPKVDEILDNPNLLSTDLFGLTDENLNNVIKEKILPFLIDYSREKLLER